MTCGRHIVATVAGARTAGSGSATNAAYRLRSATVDQSPPMGAVALRSATGSSVATPEKG
ncbi:MAG: hypothetical protein BWY91_02235 [bacterium ADurb.BinA028]|nr:MAG: hypothetical protein BWY91_02235 [bacterium ADurb.BinA028]